MSGAQWLFNQYQKLHEKCTLFYLCPQFNFWVEVDHVCEDLDFALYTVLCKPQFGLMMVVTTMTKTTTILLNLNTMQGRRIEQFFLRA